jgi:hypothetical protein
MSCGLVISLVNGKQDMSGFFSPSCKGCFQLDEMLPAICKILFIQIGLICVLVYPKVALSEFFFRDFFH